MTYKLQLTLCLLLSGVVACSPAEPPVSANGTTDNSTQKAAVAMPDRYGAEVSESILRRGGNAVDAAIAAGFALAVTFPEAGNIGGGGFMLIWMDGEPFFLDYRETAALAAHRDMFLDADGNVVENSSLIGHRAAGVPGSVAGFWEAHQRFGSLPWKDLVMPAVELAEQGFIAPDSLVEDIQALHDWFGDQTNFFDYFGDMQGGELFRQPELGKTLRRIADAGRDDFYSGQTADLIVTQMQRGDGLIAAADLQQYEAIWREPLRSPWRDYEILAAPPPSSGGFAVIQLLKIKDYLDHFFQDVPHNSAQYVHLVAEIEKRVFADRAEYLGDPDYFDVPLEGLLTEEYIQRRAQEVDPQRISQLDAVAPGLESHDTTHYSILDRWGNAVSNTYTINWDFGSGVVVEGAGFLLNNEMDDFSVKPGVPNVYGVVGNVANEIQPGKRMLSSMAPTILLRDDEVAMVIGTPGGSTIFTSVFQTIVNIEDYSMTPADAVDAGRFHHQLLPPDLITYSPSRPLPQEVILSLAERGYRSEPHSWEFGNLQVILRRGDKISAAFDPRGRGDSRVFDSREAVRD